MKKIGLALSGGGARAIVHLGVIKALEEEGIKFSKLSGTSAGAIIGALYAGGMSPVEIFDAINKLNLWSILSPVLPAKGFSSMSSLEKILTTNLPFKTFEELKLPLCISATDIESGTSVCFSEGDLIKPLLASCCIPVLFSPVSYQDKLYIDGGILNNLPAELIREDVDFIIGVHSNPIEEFKPSGVKSIMERTLLMAITCNVYAKKDLCDVFIEPKHLGSFKVLDFKRSNEIFDIGYNYTKDNMHTFGLEKIKSRKYDIPGTNTSGHS